MSFCILLVEETEGCVWPLTVPCMYPLMMHVCLRHMYSVYARTLQLLCVLLYSHSMYLSALFPAF